jgi:hypothetical protein
MLKGPDGRDKNLLALALFHLLMNLSKVCASENFITTLAMDLNRLRLNISPRARSWGGGYSRADAR